MIFLRWGCQLPNWCYFANFCRKLYENKRICPPPLPLDPAMTSTGRGRHKLQETAPPSQFITLQPFNARKEALSCYDLVLGYCECSRDSLVHTSNAQNLPWYSNNILAFDLIILGPLLCWWTRFKNFKKHMNLLPG